MSADSHTNIPAIAIHGGAGTILRANMTDEKERDIRAKLAGSLKAGHDVIKSGGTAIDAVQAAVVVMEESPLFNAGVGAVFTHEGGHETAGCARVGLEAVQLVPRQREQRGLSSTEKRGGDQKQSQQHKPKEHGTYQVHERRPCIVACSDCVGNY